MDDPQQDHPIAPAPSVTVQPEAAELPEGVTTLAAVLHELAAILPGLKLRLSMAPTPGRPWNDWPTVSMKRVTPWGCLDARSSANGRRTISCAGPAHREVPPLAT